MYKNAHVSVFFAIIKKRKGRKKMKRENLAIFKGRIKGKGTVKKFSLCNNQEKKMITVLLTDLVLSDGEKTETVDHAWFRINKKINIENIEMDAMIKFTCCIQAYYFAPDYKVQQGYRIRKIRQIKPLTKGNGHKLPSFIDEVKQTNILNDFLIS